MADWESATVAKQDLLSERCALARVVGDREGDIVGGVVRKVGRGLETAAAEAPRVGRDRAVINACAGIEVALGAGTIDGEHRLRRCIAKASLAGKHCEVRAEHTRLAVGGAVRAEHVAEITGDEQPRWASLEAPYAIGGVEVRVPVEVDVASASVE